MEAANSVLQSWAQDTSGRMPDECEVEIIFEDGLRYCGHYQLNRQEKRVSLARHVRRRLTAMTKTPYIKRGQQAANDAVIGLNERDPAVRAKTVLEHYNI